MKVESIRRHLAPYSMTAKRTTTVRHMFASALAPVEPYDRARVVRALRVLGQKDADALKCVYCGRAAQTWDHLEALVRSSKPSGYGHLIGNLVPSCKDCNSEKGNRDWRAWVATRNVPRTQVRRIERYHARYGGQAELHRVSGIARKIEELDRIQAEILRLMAQADEIMSEIREKRMAREGRLN